MMPVRFRNAGEMCMQTFNTTSSPYSCSQVPGVRSMYLFALILDDFLFFTV
jgi:hypothetical protein